MDMFKGIIDYQFEATFETLLWQAILFAVFYMIPIMYVIFGEDAETKIIFKRSYLVITCIQIANELL